MNLTRLQTFVEVVRRGTFAGAADALSFTPSAVSQQMTKLEAETGTALLVREAGGVRLTEAGGLLHEHALGIVEAVRAAQTGLEALQAEQVKRLRLGACPVAAAAVLPRALRLLRRRLPTAELLLEEAAAEATRDAVVDGRLEVGVYVVAAGGGDDPRIVETVMRREPLSVAIAADHPLTRLEQLDREALAATPRIGDGSRSRVENLRTVLALAAAGEGYALVPALAAEPLPPGLALRPLVGAPEWELRAARPASEVLSVGTLAVMDALRRVSAAQTPDQHRWSRAVGG
ncbi:MAG TPA: LysR family transcriptional regulator [Solirubrobacteraceae bacterium]|nr:LysR family transcriptional regulator [Solirubrobacteraceae bacterium]